MPVDSSAPESVSLSRPLQARWAPQQGKAIAALRAVVLLAGSVRPTQLRKAIGRFVLELPVDPQRTILDSWLEQATAVVEYFGLQRLPLRIMIDHATPAPRRDIPAGPVEARIERDPLEYRGTGGLLRDLAGQYQEDDLILVADAAQVLLEPLAVLVDRLAATPGDVRILTLPDGTPCGLMLVRCGCLRSIARIGFVDLKEQALPAIAREHDVRVARYSRTTGMPIRTLAGYLDALRAYHQRLRGQGADGGPPAEEWRPTFSLVESGAVVDPASVIHDSVVLAGGRVEASAVVVRSVVCPGGWLGPGRFAVDRFVTHSEVRVPTH
ncbi:MAG TPA: hypothetical protein VF184_01455 [Phycisphaeraceae bacterium]